MIISIFASIWCQNLGDELILKNEIIFLRQKYEKYAPDFKVFTYDKNDIFYSADDIEYCDYFPIWIKNPKNLIKNIKAFFNFLNLTKKSDLIVIWWGWIFFDEEKQNVGNPLKQWIFRTSIFRFYKKKIHFFAPWINIKNDENLTKIKSIFFPSYKITVRDEYSYILLKKLYLESNVELTKDPVFYDKLNSTWIDIGQRGKLLWKVSCKNFDITNLFDYNFKNKAVWLAFRSGYLVDDITNIKLIIDFLLEQNANIILLPHSFHKTDSIANDYDFLNQFTKNENIKIASNMHEVYEHYINKSIDINLTMRLHSMILSYVYWINFLAFSYSTKTDEALKLMK